MSVCAISASRCHCVFFLFRCTSDSMCLEMCLEVFVCMQFFTCQRVRRASFLNVCVCVTVVDPWPSWTHSHPTSMHTHLCILCVRTCWHTNKFIYTYKYTYVYINVFVCHVRVWHTNTFIYTYTLSRTYTHKPSRTRTHAHSHIPYVCIQIRMYSTNTNKRKWRGTRYTKLCNTLQHTDKRKLCRGTRCTSLIRHNAHTHAWSRAICISAISPPVPAAPYKIHTHTRTCSSAYALIAEHTQVVSLISDHIDAAALEALQQSAAQRPHCILQHRAHWGRQGAIGVCVCVCVCHMCLSFHTCLYFSRVAYAHVRMRVCVRVNGFKCLCTFFVFRAIICVSISRSTCVRLHVSDTHTPERCVW